MIFGCPPFCKRGDRGDSKAGAINHGRLRSRRNIKVKSIDHGDHGEHGEKQRREALDHEEHEGHEEIKEIKSKVRKHLTTGNTGSHGEKVTDRKQKAKFKPV